MSNDTVPCGCGGHVENFEACKYPILEATATRASAELRHAYGNAETMGQRIDPGLVARAIQILERATL